MPCSASMSRHVLAPIAVLAVLLSTLSCVYSARVPPIGIDATVSFGLDVQGHRGARGLLPENTLAGFEHALDLIEAGVRGIIAEIAGRRA